MPVSLSPSAVNRFAKLGEMSSSTNRIWIGATGLALRPTIDYFNRDVDKETRKYAAAKTAVKVAITTANGVFTRIVAEKIGHKMADKGMIKPINPHVSPKAFASGVAVAISFIATVITTFTLDIPLLNSGLNKALDWLFPGERHE